MTTLEILDALEAGILALHASNGHRAPRAATGITRASLRSRIARTGLSASEFAQAAGVEQEDLDAWLKGREPIPPWVPAAARMLALLPPAARRTLLRGAAPRNRRSGRTHPFSRIEEL